MKYSPRHLAIVGAVTFFTMAAQDIKAQMAYKVKSIFPPATKVYGNIPYAALWYHV